jgi:hypothetical protein
MSLMLKYLILSLAIVSSPVWAVRDIDLLGKLDSVREHARSEPELREGRDYVLSMMITCQFDEACMLKQIDPIQTHLKEKPNVLVSAFLKYLLWAKPQLENRAKHCKSAAKEKVREKFAHCYGDYLKTDQESPAKDRKTIDERDNLRTDCLKEHLEGLANDGNVYAQAEMMNIAVFRNDKKAVDHWYAMVEKQMKKPEYKQYMVCSELP